MQTLLPILALLPAVFLAAWALLAAVTGWAYRKPARHRLDRRSVDQYRPRPAPRWDRPTGPLPATPPVVPGPGPLTDAEKRARVTPVPAPEPAWRTDDTEELPTPKPGDRDPAVEVWGEALREHRARTPNHPAPCGFPDLIPCISDLADAVDEETRELTQVA